ncbi:MAG: HlyD family efflux transporter periplasmic adaptor subunit [Candidatus Omnitrophota bacterium]
MRKNKLKLIFVIIIIIAAGAILIAKVRKKNSDAELSREVSVATGSIESIISSTGTVLPKNRLEVKPPVNGRIESILVSEGDAVKAGQVLAWMSSTERAALLDAARGKGEGALKYWQETYKPIPLPAPIDAEVIVATTQPGQTVTTSEAVVVLSDHLIVRAQVDETDIGKITPRMQAVITIDAYPDQKIKAEVEHIYHESTTVNNVTIYEVDLKPDEVPAFFRSGMNASVDFIERSKKNALLIPPDAVYKENNENYVLVKQNNASQPKKVSVVLGISDDNNVEVLSGVNENDRVIIKTKKYSVPTGEAGTNPFMPSPRRQ